MGRKLKKVGAFLKEHWVEIALGAVMIGGGVAVAKFASSRSGDIPMIEHDDGFVEFGNSGLGLFNKKGVETLSSKFQNVPGKLTEAVKFNGEKGPCTGMTFITPVEKLGEFGEKLMSNVSEKSDSIPVTIFGVMNE